MKHPIITVFGSGCVKESESEYRRAHELGFCLARRNFTVCTGGYFGVMEAAVRGAKEADGKTLGITLEHSKKKANGFIDREIKVPTWQERLFKLIEVADGFVVCDGGTGTLTEIFTVWEMMNKEMLNKPMIFYGSFALSLLDFLRKNPFMIFNEQIIAAETPEKAAEYLVQVVPGTKGTG